MKLTNIKEHQHGYLRCYLKKKSNYLQNKGFGTSKRWETDVFYHDYHQYAVVAQDTICNTTCLAKKVVLWKNVTTNFAIQQLSYSPYYVMMLELKLEFKHLAGENLASSPTNMQRATSGVLRVRTYARTPKRQIPSLTYVENSTLAYAL